MDTKITFLRRNGQYRLVELTNLMYLEAEAIDDEDKSVVVDLYHVGDKVTPETAVCIVDSETAENLRRAFHEDFF